MQNHTVPESTGKVERFNQHIDIFLQEARLDKPKTLEELNRQLWVWLNVCYQHKSHSALPEKMSPDQCYRSDKTPRHYVEVGKITEAFMHSEVRKVDKVGCISLNSKKYEVGTGLIGLKVTIVYDLSDLREITVESEHHAPFIAKELKIGVRAGKRPDLPERLQSLPPKTSRVLNACEKQNSLIQEKVKQVISYSSIVKGGEENV